jgi:ribonuclease HI
MYADGSAAPNPGKGGAGVLLIDPTGLPNKSLAMAIGNHVTNNVCELKAIQFGLDLFTKCCHPQKNIILNVCSDSLYAINTLNKTWKAKSNRELILQIQKEIDAVTRKGVVIQWTWVKGHATDPHNCEVDRLAKLGGLKN